MTVSYCELNQMITSTAAPTLYEILLLMQITHPWWFACNLLIKLMFLFSKSTRKIIRNCFCLTTKASNTFMLLSQGYSNSSTRANIWSSSTLIAPAFHAAAAAKSRQSCPTLCNPIDSSPPGSSIHGISQARVLEWGAIAFSAAFHRIV